MRPQAKSGMETFYSIEAKTLGLAKRKTKRARGRGQALVETAICLPLLVVTLFVTLSASELYRAALTAEAASAEGARWAAQHDDADGDQIAEHARQSVAGAENAQVEVTIADLDPQEYTMHVYDREGDLRDAEAMNVRSGVTVKVTVSATLFGFGAEPFSSTHTGVRSTEGVTR